jgi:hypothetical protein
VLRSSAGLLSGAVVPPAPGPASSLMKMRGVMFCASTRVNALFLIYHSQPTAARVYTPGPQDGRPCLTKRALLAVGRPDAASARPLYSRKRRGLLDWIRPTFRSGWISWLCHSSFFHMTEVMDIARTRQ